MPLISLVPDFYSLSSSEVTNIGGSGVDSSLPDIIVSIVSVGLAGRRAERPCRSIPLGLLWVFIVGAPAPLPSFGRSRGAGRPANHQSKILSNHGGLGHIR